MTNGRTRIDHVTFQKSKCHRSLFPGCYSQAKSSVPPKITLMNLLFES